METTFERLSPPRMLGGLLGKSGHLTFWQEAFVAVGRACTWTSRAEQSPTEHISPQVEKWHGVLLAPAQKSYKQWLCRNILCVLCGRPGDYNWSLKSKDPINKI